ncbi:MAG: LysR family transcriptional regulator [Candidatus Limivivens sp.]|nr:LysR family transcriptional regulator [Candidatus Limivivens sp.]
MLDIREIQYFVVCVQTGSFSRAAEVLFTTQSTVSKVIKFMEDETGILLFERLAKGIRMTREAEQIYPYAMAVLENIQKMQPVSQNCQAETLSLSCNPSSWFADAFVRFYELHQKENLHYQVFSTDSREVARRVQERTDDLGFVYVMKNQLPAFQYFLSRNYLEFASLKETEVTLYPGKGCFGSISPGTEIDFSGLKLIQRFPDEFSPDNYWNITDQKGHTAAEAEAVITTNSDYIMERILRFGSLVNISGGYLSEMAEQAALEGQEGISLKHSDAKISFGYLKRRGESLSEPASGFLEFLRDRLRNENEKMNEYR